MPENREKIEEQPESLEGAAKTRRKTTSALVQDGPVHYEPIQARTVLNRVKAMMPLSWTINPYRGCRHACVYCFARPTHKYFDLNAGIDFHTRIFVKINAPQVLRQELSRPGWKRAPICLGSATDPYQPGERRYRLTRKILEVLCEKYNPLDIITNSHLILEDLDLLLELNRRTGGQLAVNMSLTTLDEARARLIDPGAPSPRKRMDTLARLSAAGIKTRLFIMPVLPGITDQPDELEQLVQAAAEIGVTSVSADALRIARGSEEYFYEFIEKNFPGLRPRYNRLYANGRRSMISDAYKEALRNKMAELRAKYGFPEKRLRSEEKFSQTAQAQLELRFEEPARLQDALEAAENAGAKNTTQVASHSAKKYSTNQLKISLPPPKPAARIINLQQTSFELS
jgi:DNA repair photolyase